MRNIELSRQIEYAVEDSDVTLQLKEVFGPLLARYRVDKLFSEIEMPLMPVLVAMEMEGIRLDLDVLKNISKDFAGNLVLLEKKIHEASEEIFNLDSPKQLGEALFDKLKIIENSKKTKTCQYTTSEDVLIKLELASDRTRYPRVLPVAEIKIHICRCSTQEDQSEHWAFPHYRRSDDHYHRMAQFEYPESAKHSHSQRAIKRCARLLSIETRIMYCFRPTILRLSCV